MCLLSYVSRLRRSPARFRDASSLPLKRLLRAVANSTRPTNMWSRRTGINTMDLCMYLTRTHVSLLILLRFVHSISREGGKFKFNSYVKLNVSLRPHLFNRENRRSEVFNYVALAASPRYWTGCVMYRIEADSEEDLGAGLGTGLSSHSERAE